MKKIIFSVAFTTLLLCFTGCDTLGYDYRPLYGTYYMYGDVSQDYFKMSGWSWQYYSAYEKQYIYKGTVKKNDGKHSATSNNYFNVTHHFDEATNKWVSCDQTCDADYDKDDTNYHDSKYWELSGDDGNSQYFIFKWRPNEMPTQYIKK